MAPSAGGAGRPDADARSTEGRDLRGLLDRLARLAHVRGGLIVAPDGLVIAARLPGEIRVEPLAALAATLGRELEPRGPRPRRGTSLLAELAAGDGTLFLCGTPVGFVVLLADADASAEPIRDALRITTGTLRQAWARSSTLSTLPLALRGNGPDRTVKVSGTL